MCPRSNTLIRIALSALCLLVGPAALAQEKTAYPIWWSPELKLESLDSIDWKLQKEFPRGEQFHLVTYDLERVYTDKLIDEAHPEWGYNFDLKQVNVVEQWIDNCTSLIEWTDKRFVIDQAHPYWVHASNMHALHSGPCYALEALKRARPAATSHVRDFALDENTFDTITPMIGMGWDCTRMRQFLRANQDGVSWREFIPQYFTKELPNYVLNVVDEESIVVERIVEAGSWYSEFIASTVRMSIIGRGDFDDDDIDDLLIRWEMRFPAEDGELHTLSSALYVATRRESGNVLRVVDYYGQAPGGLSQSCHPRSNILESGKSQ